MMADAEHLLEFLEGGVRMCFDVGVELVRIEFAPVSPAGFWGQRSLLGGGQITVDGAPPDRKPAGGFGFGAAVADEFDHPFTPIKAIGFHACESIRLCADVNMNCHSW